MGFHDVKSSIYAQVCIFHLQGVGFSETPIDFYQPWYHVPETGTRLSQVEIIPTKTISDESFL